MTVGHTRAREALLEELPPVTLLVGPASVGKRTLAEEIVASAGITEVLVFYEGVTVQEARQIRDFLSVSSPRAVIARLDLVHTNGVQLLLRTLEELPAWMHVVFLAERMPEATVLSRSWVFPCGYLNDAEMTQVLFDLDVPPANIPILVSRGRGQVSMALESLDMEVVKAPVVALLRAASSGDESMFGKIVSRFQETHLTLLRIWASEASTGMWRLFTPDEAYGLEPYAAVVGRALESKARSRLIVRSVIGRLMEVRK